MLIAMTQKKAVAALKLWGGHRSHEQCFATGWTVAALICPLKHFKSQQTRDSNESCVRGPLLSVLLRVGYESTVE